MNLDKLKTAASVVLSDSAAPRWPEGDDWFEPEMGSGELDYVKAASPMVVLSIIKELEELRELEKRRTAWPKDVLQLQNIVAEQAFRLTQCVDPGEAERLKRTAQECGEQFAKFTAEIDQLNKQIKELKYEASGAGMDEYERFLEFCVDAGVDPNAAYAHHVWAGWRYRASMAGEFDD